MSSRTRSGALAAALTALALAAPAAAGAAPVVRYDYAVTIAGHADWNRAGVDGEATEHSDEEFTFLTRVPRMAFLDSVAEDSSGALGSARLVRSNFRIDGGSTSQGCTTGTVKDATAGGWDAHWSATETRFSVRALEGVVITTGGCNGVLTPFDVPITSGGAAVGSGPFDAEFTVPHREIGDATITRTIRGERTGAACPNRWFNTTICSLTWEATVTFTRIGEDTVADEDVVPVPIVPAPGTPPQPTGPGSVPITPPPADVPGVVVDDPLLVPLVADATLARSAASASLTVGCAEACSGTLVATAVRGRAGARPAAAARALARTRFRVAAGVRRTVTVRFGAAARRAVRRAGAVRLTLTVAAPGRPAARRAVTVRITRR